MNGINKECKRGKTGFRGVHESRGKFEASIGFNGKRYRKAGFSTIQEAHQKVLEIARSLGIEEYYLSA